ncbi:NUDIX hydrolase [candidate division WOR-3 bacterium]|nr:NUDIX hydrolase [candidate division WOR-3 bacterium]MCK4528729.1 NUDIX hydrolase [candidate division WOR-3 bacterium]
MEKTVEEKRIYTGRLLNLNADRVSLPSGRKTFREWVHHPGAAAAIPFISEDRIILIRQFRYPVSSDLLEIPAGTIEEGESPEENIARELKEEIGYEARELREIVSFYPSPGYTDERIYLFKASNLVPVDVEREEGIEIIEVSLKEALSMIKKGKIRDGKSIIALLSCAD